jgi:GNAT superfamily N-acetyltransferase
MTRASITIRRASAEDVDGIAAVTRAAYAKWVGVIGREPLPMTVDYHRAFRRHRFDVACRDGALLGVLETVAKDDLLLIENVCVLPAAQGQGIGRRLLARAEALALSAGLLGVRLYTNARFADKLRLYAAHGYAVERQEPFRGGLLVHMVKRALPRGEDPG